ncbi:MAG TPA: Ldh family oxidoreductase [Anaerolineaceae bacterium]|nr:Ldh family oxidoreductase [Anaerolineaceae bacterium]
MSNFLLYAPDELKEYVQRFLVRHEVPPEDAAIVADVLITADLRGVSSHGIIRLDTYYGNRLRRGLIDPRTPISVVNETAATLSIDAGNGLGHVAGKHAMLRCIRKAAEVGVAMATVRNSNHYGIAGYYAMLALENDMIGISFTNSQPLVAPTHGRKAVLGTNPIAVAAPGLNERPYVLDMATSIVPIGKITVYDKMREPIPAGWGVNSDGLVTENPGDVLRGGALMPLGGTEELRGYKGYGLAMLVDIFSGVLAGAGFGPEVGSVKSEHPTNVGHFFAAVRIDAFHPADEFKMDMDRLIRMMKDSPKAAGQERIFIHGEKEFERYEQYTREGVPLLIEVVHSLEQAGEEVGVPFDLHPIGQQATLEEE